MRTGALEEFASWCLSGIVLVPQQLLCPSSAPWKLPTANGFYGLVSKEPQVLGMRAGPVGKSGASEKRFSTA